MKKRLLSALLAGSMMLTMLPTTAFAHWVGTGDDAEAPENAVLKIEYYRNSEDQEAAHTRYYSQDGNSDFDNDHVWDPVALMNVNDTTTDSGSKNPYSEKAVITLLQDFELTDTTILVDNGHDVTIQSEEGESYTITLTQTGTIAPNEGGSNAPGMDAISITKDSTLTLNNVKVDIGVPEEGAGENATQGIYNDGTLNLGQDATVTIDGVSQNGINGSGALDIENAELTVRNVAGTAVKAGATNISHSTVSATGTRAHGISVTDLTVTGDAAVTVDGAAYYGVRASGDVSMSGANTKVTVTNSSNGTIEGEEGEPTTFSEIVLGSDSTSTISLTGTISGEDIQVLGNGKTTVDGAAITGNVTNAGTGAMTIANSAISGNLASETGTVTLKGTTVSGTQTGKIEVESPYTITAANLHDTEGAVADGQLYENGSYDVNVTWNAEDEAYDVAISAENVRIHKNAAGNYGAWVGFAVEAPEGAESLTYAFAATEEGLAETTELDELEGLGNGKQGIAFYVDASSNTPKLYASVKWDNEETTTVYHIDLAGVTVSEEATTVSSITVQEKVADAYTTSATMSAAVGENNTIAVTGLTAGEDKTINLVLNTNAGGQVTKEVALTYTAETGFATEDKVTVANIEYTIDVSGLAALPANVEIEAGEPQTSVSDAIPEEQQEAVKTALTQTTVDAAPVAQAANAQITEIARDLDVEALLAQANEAEADKNYNTIKVVTYLEVSATGYTAAGEGTEAALTLEITPKYQVVATNGTDDSAPLENGDLAVEATTEPVEITIGLPKGFVSATTDPVYIYHEKAENTYVYAAKVEGTDSFTATFTNPHGFSTFVVKTSAAASITANGETTYYATLQDAVNAVENNGTITLLADGTAVVSKEVTFVVENGKFKATITAGSGYKLTEKADEEAGTINYTVTKDGSDIVVDDSGSSGGSGSTTYAVSVNTAANGTVSVSPRNASKGATVTITVTPNEGYVLGTLTATDANGDTISLTNAGNGKYTFTMPSSKVTISATFVAEGSQGTQMPFTDVASGEWYYEAVQYVYNNELMNGMSATTFEPNSTTTRGMIVTMLYRLENEPTAASAGFSDVAEGQWYTDAVNWAAANNIVNGYGDDQFGPTDTITREQMMAILYRYAQYKGYDVTASADLSAYTDAANISSYAVSAMQWAVGEGLINGITDTTLVPGGSATRAQVAAILMRFCENVAK